jgi:hypothetical protein
MFAWLVNRRQRHLDARAEATSLIQTHGKEAWQQVYNRCRDPDLPEVDKSQALAVLREIERQLGISRQADTASRYPDV